MKIQFTQQAEGRLKEIYDYYKRVASISIARKIKNEILERTKDLKQHKDLGPVDEHLKPLNVGHRKLTEGNYKIVYREEKNIIYITDVFDTRQDPEKQKS